MHISVCNEGVFVSVQEALEEIKRGTAEIIDFERVEELVKRYYESGEEYTVKLGMDPTSPDLHLGHSVVLSKLATFQKHGGRVQLIIGDFTAMIGDPSGRDTTRPMLSRDGIEKNAATYQEQAFKILDPKKTTVYHNSTWSEELGARGVIELTSHFNVARMLERDDFEKRYKNGSPITIMEFMYPLMQGYDSVALKSDIEIGGTDQKFNLHVGRTLQKAYGVGKQQAILMMPLLVGLDGVEKMSKSKGNYIAFDDDPKDFFGKVMRVSDELMWNYYELLSSKTNREIEELKAKVAEGLNPRDVKMALAEELVEKFHSKEDAVAAKEAFIAQFAKNQIPDDIPEFHLESGIWICKALQECNLEPSTSQARRDIKQGAVRIDQEKISDEQLKLDAGEYILQVGKRKFAKVKVG